MGKIKTVLLLGICLVISAVVTAQTKITGTVIDEFDMPLPGASVIVRGTSTGTTTDLDGKFSLETDKTSGSIAIMFVGHTRQEIAFNGSTDVGTIELAEDANLLEEVVIIGKGIIDLAEERKTPVAASTIRAAEIQAKAIGNVEIPEIVKSTPSVYVSAQTGFGDSQMFVRGFDQTNVAVLLNGQPVNGMEDGRVYWSNWQGVADIANGIQIQRGLGSSKLAISSIGGTMNLVMKSAERRQGGFVRFLGGNDGYLKATASYNTGMNDKGWSFSVLVDHWQADNKWAEGTFGKGQTYFLAAGYKPNNHHSFGALLTGAPQQHGQRWSQSLSTIEANPKYNQHWGYTSGLDSSTGRYTDDIESERTNFYHKPVFNFNWDWSIDDASSLSTVAYASVGGGGGTGDRGAGRIRTNETWRQMDYSAIEQQNLADPDGIGNSEDYFILEGDDDALGTEDDEEGNYIRRASMNNHFWYGLVSNYERALSESVNFNFGLDFRFYRGDHFRQIVDMYGLNGWANDRGDDIVVTETFDINPWSSLFNFADESQRIAYDYSENINYQGAFSQIEYAKNKFSTFFQGAVSNQSYQREGRMFDIGKSDAISKIGYNLKGGLAYEINDEIKIFGNAGYYSRQPFLDNIFTNIRYSNDFVQPEVDNEDITSFELGWRYDNNTFFAGFDFYHTNWNNRVILSSGEFNGVETNVFSRGVEQNHVGAELDLRYQVLHNLLLKGFWSQGTWLYKKVGRVEQYNDDTGALISSIAGGSSNAHVPTAPQTSIGLGANYKPIEKLQLRANWNYYDRLYITEPFNENGFQFQDIGTVPDYFLVDAGLSYNFEIGDDELILNGNIYNIFDRIALNGTDAFGYFNTNGLTWNASLQYKF